MNKMTIAQAIDEVNFIGTMTLEQYIRADRKGMNYRMNRSFRKNFYNDLNDIKYIIAKSFGKQNISRNTKSQFAYNAICKNRDEIMYIDA